MKRPPVKHILFSILFVLLILPFLQQELSVFKFKPLTGEFVPTEKPMLTSAGWFSGDYQRSYDKHFEENIGYRSILIRLYNQVDYTLFNLAHGGDIVVGKDGFLFQTQYLRAHAGLDFIGEEEIDNSIERIRFVNSKFRKKGIHLIVAFAPTKADFFAEYVPSFYSRKDTAKTNYDFYRKKLAESDISFIDFNDYFIKLKKSSPYPLFPKQGIHWSQYGMYLAADSLLNYIREKANLELNNLYCDTIHSSFELKSTDYDLGDLANVFCNMPHNKMPYPVLRFENNPSKLRPNVLTIGDSFFWNIYHSEIPKRIFNGTNFWYYNHDVYTDSFPQKSNVNFQTLMKVVDDQKVIIILQTESNLNNLGFGFFENTTEMLQGKGNDSLVLKIEEEIRNTPEWLMLIKKKAAEKNVPVDEMIRTDARWMAEQKMANHN